MKARILNTEFKGIYTDEFIQDNLSNIINGQLVSEWEITEILPTELELKFLNLKFDGLVYFEGATIEEIQEAENAKKQVQNLEIYNELLLTDWYVVRFVETGISIPTEILAERQAIRNRYKIL
ncbi:hypothetical protein UFOVP532_29 [uncultured Caudovirales phage]|uniref:Uncharacterized protein n=1 Tax=uncultured Caudovirales phage TaxID=2100421 RepID=A0A6J5MUI5_9CAUD|nr:hypothetical protein UFOVP532_29 [uncultured Caudovirales phage]